MTLLAETFCGSQRVIRLVTIAMLFCALVPSAFSQVEKGTFSGVVTDATGAVVANATITATNLDTNSARTIQTNSSGIYSISNLPAGIYSIRVSATGFGNVIQKAELAPGGRVTVDMQVRAAGSDTSVEVNAEAETQVETQSSALSELVSAKRVAQLPSLTRDPYDFVQTLGNVAQDSGSGSGGTDQILRGTGFSINGQRSASTDALLDGGENTDAFRAKVGQSVPLDAVQEFSLISNNFPQNTAARLEAW